MGWAIFALAIVCLGMVATFVGLYASELKKRYKAQSERSTFEIALTEANKTVNSLKGQETSYEKRLLVLRKHVEELENALANSGDAGAIRARMDKLLSEALSESGEGSSGSPGSV